MKNAFRFVLSFALPLMLGIAAAGESRQLSVYTAFIESDNALLFQAFEKDTGIAVKHVRMGAGEILTRLQAESGNPQVSVWLGGAIDSFTLAGNAGVLEAYETKNIAAVPEEYRSSTRIYTPISIGSIALISNAAWLEEQGMQPPTSWAELVTPAFKDNVCMAHPATSGAAYTAFSTILQLFGEDAGFEYLKKLDSNIVQYTKAGAAPLRMAGLGETGVAIGYNMDAGALIEEGYPLVITYPEEGTGYEVTCVALVKGGPADEAANARRFIDWLLGDNAQRLIAEGLYRTPLNRNAPMPEGMTPLSEIKTIDYNSNWSAGNKPRLVERFESEVRSKQGVR